MSFLYRHALFVSRKQPYLDWANDVSAGEAVLDGELSRRQRTVYLAFEMDGEPTLEDLLPDYWEHIFDEELAAWSLDEQQWPASRTRELFDEWFEVELCAGVFDLDPEEPLTQREVDAIDLAEAVGTCASCGISVDEGDGRYVSFAVADRARLDPWKGRVLPLRVDAEQVVLCMPAPDDSEEFGPGDDLIVRVCSSGCERAIRKVVPKALRQFFSRSAAQA